VWFDRGPAPIDSFEITYEGYLAVQQTVMTGDGPVLAGERDGDNGRIAAWLSALTPAGEVRWELTLPNPGNALAAPTIRAARLDDERVIAVLATSGPFEVDGTTITPKDGPTGQTTIAAWSNAGELLWTQTLPMAGKAPGLAADGSGNAVAVGCITGGELLSEPLMGCYILRFDATGLVAVTEAAVPQSYRAVSLATDGGVWFDRYETIIRLGPDGAQTEELTVNGLPQTIGPSTNGAILFAGTQDDPMSGSGDRLVVLEIDSDGMPGRSLIISDQVCWRCDIDSLRVHPDGSWLVGVSGTGFFGLDDHTVSLHGDSGESALLVFSPEGELIRSWHQPVNLPPYGNTLLFDVAPDGRVGASFSEPPGKVTIDTLAWE